MKKLYLKNCIVITLKRQKLTFVSINLSIISTFVFSTSSLWALVSIYNSYFNDYFVRSHR